MDKEPYTKDDIIVYLLALASQTSDDKIADIIQEALKKIKEL